jgi:transposase-like protein
VPTFSFGIIIKLTKEYMRTIFSSEEIVKLRQHPSVLSCTDRSIIYTYEFKVRALEEHKQGVGSKEIWRRAGFDISKWNKDYCKDTIKDWKQIVKKRGFEGLSKLRGEGATGRPKTKGVTDAYKIKRLELQIRYLKAENDFLAKLRAKKSE